MSRASWDSHRKETGMTNNEYSQPEIEVVQLDGEDVICTSGPTPGGDTDFTHPGTGGENGLQ